MKAKTSWWCAKPNVDLSRAKQTAIKTVVNTVTVALKCINFLLMYLVFLQTTLRHGLVSLLLERDDNQSHEYVDKEEREDHKVDHVENGGLHAETWTGALVLIGGVHRVFQDPKGGKIETNESFEGLKQV